MCLTASFLSSAVPTRYGGPGGLVIPPWVSRMYIWYQSIPAPVPAPPQPLGRLEGPSEAPEGLFLPMEAGSPPWQGVDIFPLCLGAAAVPLWLEVAGCLPWLGVGSCRPPLGAGWLLPCCWPEAPVDGVLVGGGFARSGLPLGRASGVLGAGCPARWGTWSARPPVVISPHTNPSGEVAEAWEVSSRDLSEQFSHVRHKLEGR